MHSYAALPTAIARFRSAVAEIRVSAASRETAPTQLIDASENFLEMLSSLDRDRGETGPISDVDATALGGYGLDLLAELGHWVQQHGLMEARRGVGAAGLATAAWVIRHLGRISSLELVVDALADLANRTSDEAELEDMAGFMGKVLSACDSRIQQDLEKTNPGRPWRVLHLNRGIVATRSHRPDLMIRVFDELVRALPEEAPAFFEQGMQQMVALDYPAPVRAIMARYHAAWSHPTLH